MVIESRTIQDEGIFIIPEAAKKSRIAIVQLSVLQEPFNQSLNLKIQPSRSFYGYMTALANNRVCLEHAIQFPYEEPLRYSGEHAYLLTYIHCCTRNINDNLVALLNGTAVEGNKPEWYQWHIDELRFKLYTTTILKVDINYEPIEAPCETIVPEEQAQPDPGSSNPGGNYGDPGTPPSNASPTNPNPGNIPISPPYDPNTNDNGHSGDAIPPGTQVVRITMYGDANNQNNQRVPIDTRNYSSQWEFAPANSGPFFLQKGIQFREDLFDWNVRSSTGIVYECGTYAWYETPNFRVEPWS